MSKLLISLNLAKQEQLGAQKVTEDEIWPKKAEAKIIFVAKYSIQL